MINIAIIYEGNEEKTFFNIVENNGISNKFNVKFINANGFGNIPIYYQAEISIPYFDLVVCVYDVDGKIDDMNSPYNIVRKGLKEILQSDEKVDSISFCTNPNILQFLLLGVDLLENVKLTSTSKKKNTQLITKYWKQIGSKKSYDASEWQLKIIEDSYIYGDYKYETILINAKDLDVDYKNNIPSSNLLGLLLALINGNEKFINDLIKKININERNE